MTQTAAYRENPHPTQAYRITITIKDAPGPFGWMRPLAHYDVVNPECLSPPEDNPGGRSAPVPTRPTDFKLERRSDGVYTGVVYADLMQDEDYVDNGVCHWALTSIVLQMKATGADGETLFAPGILVPDSISGPPQILYFNKISYPRLQSSELAQPLDTGELRSRFGPSIRDEDLFSITFDLRREAMP